MNRIRMLKKQHPLVAITHIHTARSDAVPLPPGPRNKQWPNTTRTRKSGACRAIASETMHSRNRRAVTSLQTKLV